MVWGGRGGRCYDPARICGDATVSYEWCAVPVWYPLFATELLAEVWHCHEVTHIWPMMGGR